MRHVRQPAQGGAVEAEVCNLSWLYVAESNTINSRTRCCGKPCHLLTTSVQCPQYRSEEEKGDHDEGAEGLRERKYLEEEEEEEEEENDDDKNEDRDEGEQKEEGFQNEAAGEEEVKGSNNAASSTASPSAHGKRKYAMLPLSHVMKFLFYFFQVTQDEWRIFIK